MPATIPPQASKPLLPPDKSTWETYSSHYEMPLAGATSIFLHGLILGLVAVGGIAFFFRFNLDAAKPPSMDMVMIDGGGTGFESLSGAPGPPGAPDASEKTEQITPSPDQPAERSEPRPSSLLPKEAAKELEIPLPDDGPPLSPSELATAIQQIKEIDAKVREAMELPKAPPVKPRPKQSSPVGAGKTKGPAGQGGEGGEGGTGTKPGPGGGGGPIGRPNATKQEIFAWRWRFDLSGDGKEHARKLAAMGVTLAIPDGRGSFFLITDLNRRPVELRKDSLVAYKDAVKWYNQRPESLQGLARELQLRIPVPFVVLLLPKEREEKMAAEEARYAQEKGRDMARIQATWFDFRLMNGSYEPTVIKQD